ncbi:hypothetical protein RDABS01_030683 [Bienertia sinuspersici]
MSRKHGCACGNGVASCVTEEGCDDSVGGIGQTQLHDWCYILEKKSLPKRFFYWLMTKVDPIEPLFVASPNCQYRLHNSQKLLRVVEGARSIDDDEEFKVAFLALCLCGALCATTCCRLRSILLPTLTVSMETNQYNCYGLLLEKLMDSSWTFKRKFEKDEYCIDVAYGERHPLQPRDTFGPKSLAAEAYPLKTVYVVVFKQARRKGPKDHSNAYLRKLSKRMKEEKGHGDGNDYEVVGTHGKRVGNGDGIENEFRGGVENEVGGEGQVEDGDGVENKVGGEGEEGKGAHSDEDFDGEGGGEDEESSCVGSNFPSVLADVSAMVDRIVNSIDVRGPNSDYRPMAMLGNLIASEKDFMILTCGDLCASVSGYYYVVSPFPGNVDENYVRVATALYTRVWRGKYKSKSLVPVLSEIGWWCAVFSFNMKEVWVMDYPSQSPCLDHIYDVEKLCVSMDALFSSVVGSSWRTSVEEEGRYLVTDDITATENERKEMVSKYKM